MPCRSVSISLLLSSIQVHLASDRSRAATLWIAACQSNCKWSGLNFYRVHFCKASCWFAVSGLRDRTLSASISEFSIRLAALIGWLQASPQVKSRNCPCSRFSSFNSNASEGRVFCRWNPFLVLRFNKGERGNNKGEKRSLTERTHAHKHSYSVGSWRQTLNYCENWQSKNVPTDQSRAQQQVPQNYWCEAAVVAWFCGSFLSPQRIYTIEDYCKSGETEPIGAGCKNSIGV